MRTINSNSSFSVGRRVETFKAYILGNILIDVGRIGKITDVRRITLVDLLLFNIRVLDIDFDGEIISASESIIKNHMRLI